MCDDHISSLCSIWYLLQACPFRGFRFETKGINFHASHTTPFEFVLFKDYSLFSFASYADQHAFADPLKFSCPDNPHAAVFSNLGESATLVSPKNLDNGDKNRYGHLAAFLRKAPADQIAKVWKQVAQTYSKVLKDQSPENVWFSTAGAGVAWLHFRFDKRPKYYHYEPFKEPGQRRD